MDDVVVAVVLAVAGIAARAYRLDAPAAVVFDEVHFGGHAAHYLNRSYFFDVHPPLGKLTLAAAAAAAGFDGTFAFHAIGAAYPPTVPYVAMRCVVHSAQPCWGRETLT
jgi:dolichyl-phosphate-mannose-protein mannosyltransferase